MSTRHRIRLAGPWEAEILHSSSHHELANTQFKAALGEAGGQGAQPFHGNLKLRRNFNLPTGLDENSAVWLCAEGLPQTAQCQISLNQQPLDRTGGGDRQMEAAITDALENFNRIEMVLNCSGSLVQITENPTSILVQASVWLEIA